MLNRTNPCRSHLHITYAPTITTPLTIFNTIQCIPENRPKMEFVTALRGSFDPGKPSLFELLSEQQLSSLLPPTLRYLLTLLTHRYPRHLLRALNSFDELYALLSLLIERHYLLTRQGSFTENFYGLKRERALTSEIPRASTHAPQIVREALALRTKDVYKNLFVIVLIPYLKRKLDEAHEVDAPRALLGAAYNAPPSPSAPLKEKLGYYYKIFLRKIYPTINMTYHLSILAFSLGYLFDNTKYSSPFLWLIGTRIRRMGPADYKAIEEWEKVLPADGTRSRSIFQRLLSSLSLVLPTSIFALKFLEWWYSSDFAKQLSRKAAESLQLPPPGMTTTPKSVSPMKQPPPSLSESSDTPPAEEEWLEQLASSAPVASSSLLPIFTAAAIPREEDDDGEEDKKRQEEDSSLCPICQEEITTPTACQTGIVYCYGCIHKWISGANPHQERFMERVEKALGGSSRKWESGEGRCAVTGRRVLGGVEGLRRVMV
ncbi:ubiquitin-protein ligase peroxin 12 [Podospora bellae-mahoneyi]|uniref:Peroxisome assembly protein 12 n=1 Tax=Podospora bellae-mahoneyi TaxID=2093777 RepID=A0ABR0FLX8_9PEZI|nr:ubiquitin-protein ligase peroxin 12 [Podospora bellae-mahoneyi]